MPWSHCIAVGPDTTGVTTLRNVQSKVFDQLSHLVKKPKRTQAFHLTLYRSRSKAKHEKMEIAALLNMMRHNNFSSIVASTSVSGVALKMKVIGEPYETAVTF